MRRTQSILTRWGLSALMCLCLMAGGVLTATSCGSGGPETELPPDPDPDPDPDPVVDDYPESPDFGAPGANYAQWMEYFSDPVCSRVKSSYSLEALDEIDDVFFRNLAKSLWYYQNEQTPGADEDVDVIAYDPTFHIVEVQAYLRPRLVAEQNKTAPYGRLDNASGIHVKRNENVVIFVEKLDVPMTALLIDPMKPTATTGNSIDVQSVTLREGFNTFKAAGKGLLYFVHHADNANWKNIKSKVHVASGVYNGIYIMGKTDPSKWRGILDRATFSNLDMIGDYTHMILPLTNLKQNVPDADPLLETFDTIVYEEQVFAGLEKYDRMNPTRMTVIGGSFSSHMFALSSNEYAYTGYSLNGLKELMPVEVLKTTGIWGPAHELGHVNQMRPAFRWGAGTVNGNWVPGSMTEVSNNVFSLYIQTMFGNRSRIAAQGDYDVAFRRFLVEKLLQTAQINPTDGYENVFNRLVPFWQLYLYFTKAEKYTGDAPEDFYKDLMEALRNDTSYNSYTNNATNVRYCMDRFAYHVSRVARINMVKFFNDFGFALSSDMVSTINALGYPEPALEMRYITDDNSDLYKTPAAVVAGTADMTSPSTNNYAVTIKNGSSNVVAYEVYTSSSASASPIFITTVKPTFAFMSNAARTSIVIKAVGADGTRGNVTIVQQ